MRRRARFKRPDHLPVQASLADLVFQGLQDFLGLGYLTVGARAGQGIVDVGGGHRLHQEGYLGKAVGVAGAIQLLVVPAHVGF